MAYALSQFVKSNAVYNGNIEINACVESSGAIEFFLPNASAGTTAQGYILRFDARNANRGLIIYRLNTTETDISTYKRAVNSGALTGSHSIRFRYHSVTNKFEAWLDGTLAALATDAIYTPNGPVGYGNVTGTSYISRIDINGHSGIHPDNKDPNDKAYIDFTQAGHTGKDLDNIGDGSDYVRGTQHAGGTDLAIDNRNFRQSATMPPVGWSTTGAIVTAGAVCSYDATTHYRGTKSLKVVTTLANQGIVSLKQYPVVQGDTLKMTWICKSDGTAGIYGKLSFWKDDASFVLNYFMPNVYLGTAWSVQTGSVVVPTDAVYAILVMQTNAAGTVWLDSVNVQKVRSMDDEVIDGVTNYRPRISASKNSSQHPVNGGFEIFADTATVADDWTQDFEATGSGNVFSRSATAYQGTYAQSIQNNGASGGTSIASRPIDVHPNHKYTIRVRCRSTVANPGTLILRVVWYSDDADLTRFGTSMISYDDIATGGPTVINTWQLFSGVAQAPSNAVFARVALYNWTGTACTLLFDTCSVQPYLISGKAIETGAVTAYAEDRETSAVTLTRNSYIVVAKVTYQAEYANSKLRFLLEVNLNLASFSTASDEVDWEIVMDQSATVGSAVVGGTVVSGPLPIKLSVSAGPTSSPTVHAAAGLPGYVVADTSSHTYSLAVKMNTGGTTLTGNTVAGSSAAPSACIEVGEHKR